MRGEGRFQRRAELLPGPFLGRFPGRRAGQPDRLQLGARAAPARWSCWPAARSPPPPAGGGRGPAGGDTAAVIASCWWPRPATPIGFCPAIATAALALVERMLVTTNALRPRAAKVSAAVRPRRPRGHGLRRPLLSPQPGGCDKIEVIDVACSVGRPTTGIAMKRRRVGRAIGLVHVLGPLAAPPGPRAA